MTPNRPTVIPIAHTMMSLERWRNALPLDHGQMYTRTSIVELFAILRDIFSKEPPVKGRLQSRQPETPRSGPPPVPPLPPELSTSPRPAELPSTQPQQAPPRPPQLPPKPGQTARVQSPPAAHTPGPAVPPLPPKAQNGHNQEWSTPINAATAQLNRSASLRSQQSPVHANYQRDPHTDHPPVPVQSHGPYQPQQMQSPRQYAAPQPLQGYQQAVHQQQYPSQAGVPFQGNQYQPPYQSPQQTMTAPKPPKPQTPDLLTSPFDVELPSITPTGPPPPVPPNPEKDALLHTLSRTLTENLQGNVSQSKSAVTSLQSQSQALSSAMITLQGELATLNNFKATIQSNINILQQSLHRADAVIADAKARTGQSGTGTTTATGLPAIDDVLVAPTVVGKQLYDLVADERGIQQAIYALQAALVKGVIGADIWSRHTRSLAREAFIKRALIRKIALGMGLDLGEDALRPES
uniref:Tumor susceptibility protein n=1 Tax=Talaromyces marneffei PM1 TaxID=1077442 RepID=A0A093VK38_TALMA